MDNYTNEEMKKALSTIASMISKTEIAKVKLGTSQHTLQKNRLKALNIASSLISEELSGSNDTGFYPKEDLEKALAPIVSLISKSEKAQKKLAQGTWQYTMLSHNLKALYIALPLLEKALTKIDTGKDQML